MHKYDRRTVLLIALVALVVGLLLGVMTAQPIVVDGQAVIAGQEWPVLVFTPNGSAAVHVEPDAGSPVLRFSPAGESLLVYTPYVGLSQSPLVELGGDGLLWAATSPARDAWVAVAVHGYCPRERLGTLEGR